MVRTVIMIGWVLLAAVHGWSQEERVLTLGEARERARERGPGVRAAREEVLGAAARAGEAHAARLPQVAVTAQYARLSEVPAPSVTVPAVGRVQIAESLLDQYRLGGVVSLPLFTGFRLANAEWAAGHLEKASRHELGAVEATSEAAAERAYWNLHRARAAQRTIGESARLVAAHLADVRRLQAAGLATEDDVLEAEVRLAEVRLRLVQAGQAAELAQAVLARAAALPIEARIALVDSPRVIDAGLPELEALQQRAAEQRPELAAVRERVETAARQVAVARGERLPSVHLQAGYDLANPNARYFPQEDAWHDTWSVGLGMTWTAWDWGTVEQRQQRAAAVRRQLEAREQELREGIALEVLQGRLAAVEAARRIELAREGIAQAEARARSLRRRFAAGTAASTEVLDAEVALERARLALVQGLADQQLAWAELERVTGGGLR